MGRTDEIIRYYPDQALLEELRRVAELSGKPVLTGAEFIRVAGLSADTIRRRFGSWREALQRAGLGHMYSGEPENRRKYTDEQLLDELRRAAELSGKPFLLGREFSAISGISQWTVMRRFGRWRQVLERAGLTRLYSGEPENARVVYGRRSDDELLDELRRVASLADRSPLVSTEFMKYSRITPITITSRFGDWVQALARAGLPHRASVDFLYSEEELIEEIRRIASLIDKQVFTLEDFRKHSVAGISTIQHRFGSWQEALERAGLPHRYYGNCQNRSKLTRRLSDEDLLDEVRRIAAAVGKPVLKVTDYQRQSTIASYETLRQRLGGWKTILNRAGLGHMCADSHRSTCSHYSENELLEELRSVARIVNKFTLSTCDFNKHAKIGCSTITAHFHTWREALSRAGLVHLALPIRRHSDEELLLELRRVAGLIDTPALRMSDFERNSSICSQVISNRFGGWMRALERAGLKDMCSRREIRRKANNK